MSRLLDETASGVFIISATPFDETGVLDLSSLDGLIEFYLRTGVSGMTILGVMGEAPKLSQEEARRFTTHVLRRVDGRVPVVVGVSSPGLENLASLAEHAMNEGAAGVMVAPPPTLRTETQVVGYMAAVAERLGAQTPICYQDFPLTTGVAISAETCTRLAAEIPSIVMLKHEDWPGLQKLSAVRRGAEAAGVRRLSILTGNGGCYLPQELARGADGAMTGFAFPEMLVEVVRRHRDGDPDRAEDVFDAYLPLARHEQMPGFGLAIRKEILHRRGIIASARLREPGPKLTKTDHEELTRLLDRLERRVAALGA